MGQLSGRVVESVEASTARLVESAAALVPSIAAAIIALALFWAAASVLRRLIDLVTGQVDNPTARALMRQVPYYTVWAIGVVVALDTLGVDTASLATGLGLGGVALGFALKDVLSNLVSGVLILVMRTFDIDDQIVVGETEGTVERIEVRATHIRTYDGRLVLVPNGEVFTSRVTNNTESPQRRATVNVYLDYRQDLERALPVILTAMTGVKAVAPAPAPSMRVRELTLEGLHIEARFWTDSRRTDYMNTASDVRVAIVRALHREGIAMPQPDERRVVIEPVQSAAADAPS